MNLETLETIPPMSHSCPCELIRFQPTVDFDEEVGGGSRSRDGRVDEDARRRLEPIVPEVGCVNCVCKKLKKNGMKFDSVETSSLKPTLPGKQRPQPERRKTAEEEGNEEKTERVQGETRDSCGCGGRSEEEEEEERPSSSFQKRTTKEKTEAVEGAAISGLTGKAKTSRGNGEEKRKFSSTRRSEDVEDAVVGVDGGVEGMRTSMREV